MSQAKTYQCLPYFLSLEDDVVVIREALDSPVALRLSPEQHIVFEAMLRVFVEDIRAEQRSRGEHDNS